MRPKSFGTFEGPGRNLVTWWYNWSQFTQVLVMALSKDSPDIEVSFQNQGRMKKYTILLLMNAHRFLNELHNCERSIAGLVYFNRRELLVSG